MKLNELTQSPEIAATLPIKTARLGDVFVSTCEGIDHESWGASRAEAQANFLDTLRGMKEMNTESAFASFFTNKKLLSLV